MDNTTNNTDSETVAGSSQKSGESELFQDPMTLICPWAPNGSSDINARTLAQLVGAKIGQTITVENVLGDFGAKGFDAMLSAEPDGNTIGIATAELTTLPPQGKGSFHLEDFEPIIRMNTVPACVAVAKNAPYNTLEELVAYAKEHPGELRSGDVGEGSIWYICSFELEETAGIKFKHQSYDGASIAADALKNGELDVLTMETSVMQPFAKKGSLKILAVMSEERLNAFPDYPTCKECGYDLVAGSYQGIICSAKVSEEKRAELERLFTEAYNSPEYQEFCDSYGLEKSYLNSSDFSTFLEESLESAIKILKKIGLA